MSKKDKNIEVEIAEAVKDGKQVQQVLIGKNIVGEVKNSDGKFTAILTDGEEFNVHSFDEGIEVLLQQYHLHQG
ncbi:hypothetical protein FC70_GL000397 [Paucilactobacillus oligofermentans DSM 15707 = LMG 22743]|uniref:DUF2969 domain-containing protein n=1 Tax=Paucilactobacillus oligofermentans DSM 15707 = LMG 22743 TaxID=1423778 RepID=A0A0R1RWZ8_9LACO|nr:DUF2969 domain-containing protein [Paucilactobacillus oligofermentans]KRL57923.1 hypothetical protein FC70_GL000397 [Paucilactobacillus oligofermentans DSM 15707 = LMG 22743]CUS26605.1 Uncharacterized protein LACOL_1297 [Paucilactobacillus oligofermentans DSM 15707 = LMG 22743]